MSVADRPASPEPDDLGHCLALMVSDGAPDVIMRGEIRDKDPMQHAMAYAETAHREVLMDLSLNLKGVVGQRRRRGTAAKKINEISL
ncbi:hypothetical protein [Polaromonas sp.]|uniref:hypothetical protein n=1 Tax=Polaromonas sp. TaxID=1869339 RepID=UPI00352041CE